MVLRQLEFLQRNEKFVLYCDDRRDRSQLFFPETETLAESGVPNGTTIVFRTTGSEISVVVDQGTGQAMNYSVALTHATRTSIRLDLHSSLRSNVSMIAQRMSVGAAPHEYGFYALSDRGLRPLRMALSLTEQQIGAGSVIVMQATAALMRYSLDSIDGISRAGYLVKKSIKNDKVTKNKKRWCVLADQRLFYFKSNAGSSRPAGVILLEYYTVSDKAMSGQFMLQHSSESRGSPDFVLSLETFAEQELEAWKWAIRERCEAMPLMGVSLVELARINNQRPPLLVEACIDQLMQVAPGTEGLFRLSGQQDDVEQLVSDFQFNRSPPLESLSAHVVAGALKQFLRELPVPLLTWDLHDAFCAAAQKRNHNDLIDALQKCILKLPTMHQVVLEMLLGLAEAIDAASDISLMNAKNLSVALTPSILQPPSRDPMPSREQLAAVAALIVHRSEIFASLAELYEEEEIGRARPRSLGGPMVGAAGGGVGGGVGVGSGGPGGPFAAKTVRGVAASVRAAGPAPRPKASDVFGTATGPPTTPPTIPPGVAAPSPSERSAVAKFTYSARTDKEVSLTAGTECAVLKTYPNGWSLVETGGVRGIVPSSYLQELGPVAAASSLPSSSPGFSPRKDASPAPFASVRAAPVAARKVPTATDVFKKPAPIVTTPPPSVASTSSAGTRTVPKRDSEGPASAEGWRMEAESLRREVEALKEQVQRERERADAEREAARDTAESVASCRKEVERLKQTVNRVMKDKDSGSALVGEKIVELEEEIEVLDTRIEQEETARKGMEAAVMALVSQLQSDSEYDRAAIDKLQRIVDAWSQ